MTGAGYDAERAACVEDALRAACARAAAARPLAGFDLFAIPAAHPFLRALALPRDADADGPAALAELVAVCRALGIVPRIELLAERRPKLRARLAASGWVRTLAVPVLARSIADEPMPDAPPADAPPSDGAAPDGPARPLDAAADEALLAATLEAQHAILGAASPSPAERAGFRACLADRSVRTWVRLDERGRPVAAASLLGAPPAVELAGLWCRPDRRRRGLARSVARAALIGAGEGGCRLVWAGAASAASAALLGGLGMVRSATLESWERIGRGGAELQA